MFIPPRTLPVQGQVHAVLSDVREKAAARSFISRDAKLVGSSYRGREGREEVVIAYQRGHTTQLRVVSWSQFRERCRTLAGQNGLG